jgi:phosphoribulokinase
MATLKTNTLTGTSTAGSIAVTGEGNSTTTNLQQGLCKVWLKFNFNDSSSTGDDSFNVTSLTDSDTGDFTINIANDFANANFAHLGMSNDFHVLNDSSNTAGTMNTSNYNSSNSATDVTRCFSAGFGDLA